MSSTIKEGTVATVHSLKSAAGKKLNGSRVLVLKRPPLTDEGRWEVRVEFEDDYRTPSGTLTTKAIKAENLKPLPRLPKPTGNYRGFADVDIHGRKAVVKLCELLVYSTEDFKPSEIMFIGYASMAFQRMGQQNFQHFYCSQMEQMGAVLALGNLARECEIQGTESIVFALLEGDEMYIDVLIQQLAWTGLIREGDEEVPGFISYNGPLEKFTPDQESAPYVRTMSEGPVLLLLCVSKYVFAPALWAAMSNSEFYHLLIQRLLRFVAREVKGTLDGRALGHKARKILSSMFPDVEKLLKQPISMEAADKILTESSTLLSEAASVTSTNVKSLLKGGS